jgi:hypothetical protein
MTALSKGSLCNCSIIIHPDHKRTTKNASVAKEVGSVMTTLTTTVFARTSLRDRFETIRTQMAENASKRKVYLTTLSELERTSARDLQDLGIAPSSIRQIAHKAAYSF